jgi:hypothetical protein
MTIIACSNSHMLEEKKKKKEKKELGSMQLYYIVIQQVSSVTRASSPQSFDQCQSVSLVDRTCKVACAEARRQLYIF